MTPLQEGASAMHELYACYVEAGFAPEQALQIVIAQTVAAAGQAE